MQLDNRPDIVKVRAILDNGEEINLEQRPLGNTGSPSQSTFFGERTDGSFAITLRIDWDDLDTTTGDPMLDADTRNNGKKYFTERKKWHHSRKTFDAGEWVYNFEFGNVKLRFKLGITSQRDQTAKARIEEPFSLSMSHAIGEKQILCAACRSEKKHTLVVDYNQEIVATCECGHFIKFAVSDLGDELDAQIARHNRDNKPRNPQP